MKIGKAEQCLVVIWRARHVHVSLLLIAICEMHVFFTPTFSIIPLVCLEEIQGSLGFGGLIYVFNTCIIEIFKIRCYFSKREAL